MKKVRRTEIKKEKNHSFGIHNQAIINSYNFKHSLNTAHVLLLFLNTLQV